MARPRSRTHKLWQALRVRLRLAPRMAPFRFAFWFFIFFGAIDIVLFRWLLWELPNETTREELVHYNFEHQARRLASGEWRDQIALAEARGLASKRSTSVSAAADPTAPADSTASVREFRVLVVGSSVALYSVLPDLLQRRIQAELPEGAAARVELLSHQGMSPLHLQAYADRLLATQPDLIVLPTNAVDFRLERPIMLGLLDRLYPHKGAGLENPGLLNAAERAEREAALDEITAYIVESREFRLLAPWQSWRLYRGAIHRQREAELLLASMSAAYRYRLFARDPVALWLDNRFSSGRSYEGYAGLPVGGENISDLGWTGARFALPVTPALLDDGLWLEAPAPLFAGLDAAESKSAEQIGAASENETPHLQLRIIPAGDLDANDPGESSADENDFDANDSRDEIAHRIALKPGWQRLDLRKLGAEAGDRLEARTPTWFNPLTAREDGLRLTRNAGRSEPLVRDDLRELRREDALYLGYDDPTYRASFAERVLRFDRAGTEYLEAIQIARQSWGPRPFDAALPGFVAFAGFRRRILAADVPLAVVGSPENPLSFAWWGGDARFYHGMLAFLAQSPGGSSKTSDMYYFWNADQLLPMQQFYDFHHLSYYGARTFTDFLGDRLAPLVRERVQFGQGDGEGEP